MFNKEFTVRYFKGFKGLYVPFIFLGLSCKVVVVELGPDELWRFVGEWIVLDQLQDLSLSSHQSVDQVNKPGVVLVAAQSRKPHLPVQARLMRG